MTATFIIILSSCTILICQYGARQCGVCIKAHILICMCGLVYVYIIFFYSFILFCIFFFSFWLSISSTIIFPRHLFASLYFYFLLYGLWHNLNLTRYCRCLGEHSKEKRIPQGNHDPSLWRAYNSILLLLMYILTRHVHLNSPFIYFLSIFFFMFGNIDRDPYHFMENA